MKLAKRTEREILDSIESKRETLFVGKGLTRLEALRKARRRWRHDHRGFTYDPKTGKASAI